MTSWALASPSAPRALDGGVQTRSQSARQQTPVQDGLQGQPDPVTPPNQTIPAAAPPPGAPRKKLPTKPRRPLSLAGGAPVRKLDFDETQVGLALQQPQPGVAATSPASAAPTSKRMKLQTIR